MENKTETIAYDKFAKKQARQLERLKFREERKLKKLAIKEKKVSRRQAKGSKEDVLDVPSLKSSITLPTETTTGPHFKATNTKVHFKPRRTSEEREVLKALKFSERQAPEKATAPKVKRTPEERAALKALRLANRESTKAPTGAPISVDQQPQLSEHRKPKPKRTPEEKAAFKALRLAKREQRKRLEEPTAAPAHVSISLPIVPEPEKQEAIIDKEKPRSRKPRRSSEEKNALKAFRLTKRGLRKDRKPTRSFEEKSALKALKIAKREERRKTKEARMHPVIAEKASKKARKPKNENIRKSSKTKRGSSVVNVFEAKKSVKIVVALKELNKNDINKLVDSFASKIERKARKAATY